MGSNSAVWWICCVVEGERAFLCFDPTTDSWHRGGDGEHELAAHPAPPNAPLVSLYHSTILLDVYSRVHQLHSFSELCSKGWRSYWPRLLVVVGVHRYALTLDLYGLWPAIHLGATAQTWVGLSSRPQHGSIRPTVMRGPSGPASRHSKRGAVRIRWVAQILSPSVVRMVWKARPRFYLIRGPGDSASEPYNLRVSQRISTGQGRQPFRAWSFVIR